MCQQTEQTVGMLIIRLPGFREKETRYCLACFLRTIVAHTPPMFRIEEMRGKR